jgi:hypothetical protein
MGNVCKYNTLARSRNHCCNGNATIFSIFNAVDLYVAVSNIKCCVLPTKCHVGSLSVAVELQNISTIVNNNNNVTGHVKRPTLSDFDKI